MFKQYEDLLKEIKRELAKDEIVSRIILINTPDALTKEEIINLPTDSEPFIYIRPVISLADANLSYSQSTFIVISISNIGFNYKASGATINIDIFCADDVFELEEGRLRLFVLADRIKDLIDEHKFTPAGQLKLDLFSELNYNKNVVGYSMTFSCSTGESSDDFIGSSEFFL